ncbi:MAG: hypothetical protein JF616_14670 [Fibrobacteres bacterium]|nr:hypothetical protein [Fibrobacterota bacterium]
MYSLHLTGSAWFLLLIPVGLWILWRAYGGGTGGGGAGGIGSGRGGRVLFALQALALVLLALSLSGPELRRHNVRFHNPAILILRDQSASFRDGAVLGLGSRYSDFQARLASAYGAKKFDVRVADFAASVWPVSGFPHAPGPPAPAPGDPTSLGAAADFADTAAIPNLQAVFLFSDGRAVLDSGRSARAWRVPVYPVEFMPDSVAEVQAVSVALDGNAAEVKWEPVGKVSGDPQLRLLRGGRILLTRNLPGSAPAGADGSRSSRFAWSPPPGAGTLRATLEPATPAANFDRWNDTVPVAASGSAAARRVFILKPIRSLDERGMVDALRAEGNLNVTFFSAEETAGLAPAAGDQVWMEAGALANAKLAAWLGIQAGKAVIYARTGEDGFGRATAGSRTLPGLPDAPWAEFTPAAEIKSGKSASDAFPDEVVRLKSLSPDPLRAPAAPARGTSIEIKEGTKRAMLMGRIPMGQGKRAFFFCLPAIWGNLFDPQGDFSTRENIGAYVRAAYALAGQEESAARVSLPRRAIAGIPFDAEIDLPEGASGESDQAAACAFGAAGPGLSKEWLRPAAAGNASDWTAKAIVLPAGRFRLWVRIGADTLWRDSLAASPQEALELARLGFDAGSLADLAARSGGALLRPSGSEVTSLLPTLPDAQLRMDRTVAIRLYNTLPIALLVLILLSASWALRKKWDFD